MSQDFPRSWIQAAVIMIPKSVNATPAFHMFAIIAWVKCMKEREV